jgi:hypothetical protein
MACQEINIPTFGPERNSEIHLQRNVFECTVKVMKAHDIYEILPVLTNLVTEFFNQKEMLFIIIFEHRNQKMLKYMCN